jgi:hypothetical protein
MTPFLTRLRTAAQALRGKEEAQPPPPPAPAPVVVDPIIQRLLRGEGDEVLNLLRAGDLSWHSVFGMEGFIVMSAHIPGFNPDSYSDFRTREVLAGVKFLDEVLMRVRNGHHVLRHDDPVGKFLGFADATDRYIGQCHLFKIKEVLPEHPGYEAYVSLPPSTMNVRVALSMVDPPPVTKPDLQLV